jgi:hypothetical protein
MIDKILIFNTDVKIPDTTNKNDRDIFYEQFSGKLPTAIMESFYRLNQYDKFTINVESTIDTIILQQVLPYTIPIIEYIPESEDLIDYKPKAKFESPYIQTQNHGIIFKLEYDQQCIYGDTPIMVSKYTTINIIGLQINPNLDYLKLLNLDGIDTSGIKHWPVSVTDNDMIWAGLVSNYDNFTNKFYHEAGGNLYWDRGDILFDDKENKVKLTQLVSTLKVARIHYEMRVGRVYNQIYKDYAAWKQNPWVPLAMVQNPILKNFEKILDIALLYPNTYDAMLNIFNMGHYDKYQKAAIGDASAMDELKYMVSVRNSIAEQQTELSKQQLNLLRWRNIAFSKFGKWIKLTKSERDVVDLAYENSLMIRKEDPQTHIKMDLAKSLMEAMNVGDITKIKSNLVQLSGYKTLESGIICEHNIEKAKMLLDDYRSTLDKNRIIRNALITKYGDVYDEIYYCRTCGEKLSFVHQNDQVSITNMEYNNNETYDELYHKIYREAMYICNNFISFSDIQMYSIYTIIKNITDIVKDEIHILEVSLTRVKTFKAYDVSLTLGIYIYVYIFAFLTQLIYTNESIVFKSNLFSVKMDGGGDVSPFIEDKTENTSPFIEDKTENTSPFIEDKTENTSPFIEDKTEDTSPFIEDKTKDTSPFIEDKTKDKTEEESPYIMGGRATKKPKIIKQKGKLTKNNTESILKGKAINTKTNIKQLQRLINTALTILIDIKNKDIQESQVINKQSIKGIFLNAYRFITKINYVALIYSNEDYWYKNNSVIDYFMYAARRKHASDSDDMYKITLGRTKEQIIADLKDREKRKTNDIYDTLVDPGQWSSDKYVNDSLGFLYRYIHDKFYRENPANHSSEYGGFIKGYKHLKDLESLRLNRERYISFRPLYKPMYITSIGNTMPKSMFKSCMGKCDEYIYQKTNANGEPVREKITLKKTDIDGWVEVGNHKKLNWFKQWKLIEIKCRCKGVTEDTNVQMFYDYYRNNCVFGDVHTFKEMGGGNICSKCGITDTMLETFDPVFYKKYLPRYTKIKKMERHDSEIPLDFIMSKGKPKTTVVDPKLRGWKSTEHNIRTLATLLEWKVNVINNIGLYEKREYTKDFDTIKIPPIEDEILRRNNTLYGYYLYIIRSYYILRNFDSISYPPQAIKNFVHRFPGANIEKKLDIINTNLLSEIEFRMQTLETLELSNYLLDTISQTLLKIHKIFDRLGFKKFGLEFIKLLLGEIIRYEKKLSKFDMRKMLRRINKSRSKDKPTISTDDIDKEIDNDILDDTIDDMDDQPEPENLPDLEEDDILEQDEGDIFSLGDIDVEEYDEDTLYKDVGDKLN